MLKVTVFLQLLFRRRDCSMQQGGGNIPRGAQEAFLLLFSIELALTHFDFEEKTTIDLCIRGPVRERKDSWRRAMTR